MASIHTPRQRKDWVLVIHLPPEDDLAAYRDGKILDYLHRQKRSRHSAFDWEISPRILSSHPGKYRDARYPIGSCCGKRGSYDPWNMNMSHMSFFEWLTGENSWRQSFASLFEFVAHVWIQLLGKMMCNRSILVGCITASVKRSNHKLIGRLHSRWQLWILCYVYTSTVPWPTPTGTWSSMLRTLDVVAEADHRGDDPLIPLKTEDRKKSM